MLKYRLQGFFLGITFGFCIYSYCKYKYSQKNQRKAKIVLKYLLIGSVGVGKTKLFTKFYNSISKKNQAYQITTEFKECPLTKDIALVDTPSINFESSIDLREFLISQFTKYMMNNNIQHFFLVVNFERTDLMKKKILEVLKYFKKFKDNITVVVSNFQLSENEENDTNSLRKELKVFLNNKQSIIFVRDDFDIDQLRNEFLQNANAFSLKDTIFEPSNELESQQIMALLTKQLNDKIKGNHLELLPQKENKKIEEKFNQKFHNYNYNYKENGAHQIEQQQEQTEQQNQSQLLQQQQQEQQNSQEINNEVKEVAQNQLGQQEQIQKEDLNQSKKNDQYQDLEDKSTLSPQ